MAVAGERVERDIARHPDFGGRGLHGADDVRNQPVRIGRFRPGLIFEVGADMGKNGERRNAELPGAHRSPGGLIDVEAVHPRHGANRNALLGAVMDDEAPDEIIRRRTRLADQTAHPVRLTQASWSRGREGACDDRSGHGGLSPGGLSRRLIGRERASRSGA